MTATSTAERSAAAAVDRSTAAAILSASDTLTVIAWHDPTVEQATGAIPTDSDDALVTGRVRVFGSCECCRTGR